MAFSRLAMMLSGWIWVTAGRNLTTGVEDNGDNDDGGDEDDTQH